MRVSKRVACVLSALTLFFSYDSFSESYVIRTVANGVVSHNVESMTFSIDKNIFYKDELVTVSWNVVGDPYSIELSNYGKLTTKSGTLSYKPGQVSEITLSADTGKKIETKSFPVTVMGYEGSVLSFGLDKTTFYKNDNVSASWSFATAPRTVTISGYGKINGNAGTVSFKPGLVNSITLDAYFGSESTPITKTIPVTSIDYGATDVAFSLSKTTFTDADTIKATWNVGKNPKKVEIVGYGVVSTNSGNVSYKPGITTAIKLNAFFGDDPIPVTKTIPVSVTAAPIVGTLGTGSSCDDIKLRKPTSVDGDYTILNGTEKTIISCDMTTNSAGWMLLDDFGIASPLHALNAVDINTPELLVASGYSVSNLLMARSYQTHDLYLFAYQTPVRITKKMPTNATQAMIRMANNDSLNKFSISVNGTVVYRPVTYFNMQPIVINLPTPGSEISIYGDAAKDSIVIDKLWIR